MPLGTNQKKALLRKKYQSKGKGNLFGPGLILTEQERDITRFPVRKFY